MRIKGANSRQSSLYMGRIIIESNVVRRFLEVGTVLAL